MQKGLDRLSGRLARANVKVAHASALLPDLAESARVYMRLLSSSQGAGLPTDLYDDARRSIKALAPDDHSLAAERIRGTVLSHRDWSAARVARARFQQQWSALFREWDVLIFPITPTPAFHHDHSLPQEARRIEINGREYPYVNSHLVWAGLATMPGLPATAIPIDRTDAGLPIGAQIVGPYLEDHTTIAFAGLL